VAFIALTEVIMSTSQLARRRVSRRHHEQPPGLPDINPNTGLVIARTRSRHPSTANVTPPANTLGRSETSYTSVPNNAGHPPHRHTVDSTNALLTQNQGVAFRRATGGNLHQQAPLTAPTNGNERPPNEIAARGGGTLHENEELESLTTATNHVIMLSENSSQHWHDTCVREHLFPNQKFLMLKTDLDFSNRPGSVCRRMAAKCHVPDHEVELWWDTAKKTVYTTLKLHRNNVIKSIKTTFMGKLNSVFVLLLLVCYLINLSAQSFSHYRSTLRNAEPTRRGTTHNCRITCNAWCFHRQTVCKVSILIC